MGVYLIVVNNNIMKITSAGSNIEIVHSVALHMPGSARQYPPPRVARDAVYVLSRYTYDGSGSDLLQFRPGRWLPPQLSRLPPRREAAPQPRVRAGRCKPTAPAQLTCHCHDTCVRLHELQAMLPRCLVRAWPYEDGHEVMHCHCTGAHTPDVSVAATAVNLGGTTTDVAVTVRHMLV